MLSLWIRNNITDRALAPLRKQIAELTPDRSSVIDVGCANGRLLFDIAERINKGLGLDLDNQMISYALDKSKALNNKNLESLEAVALEAVVRFPFQPSTTVCSLCLHAML